MSLIHIIKYGISSILEIPKEDLNNTSNDKQVKFDFNVEVAPPEYGDFATNIAMILCKERKVSPMILADELSQKIQTLDFIESVSIAKPGFINLKIKKTFIFAMLSDVIFGYGIKNIGNGVKINVEYVSANPTGPLHVGHLRGAIYGDVLAELLAKSGYDVTREYYINDAGNQINILEKSLCIRYMEVLGKGDGVIPDGYYPGEYLIDVAKKLVEQHGSNLKEDDSIFETFATSQLLEIIKNDLRDLNIIHDVFSSEKEIVTSKTIESAIDVLRAKDLIYEGIPEKPKSDNVKSWEPRKQELFMAKKFGDDEDRSIKKPDGSYTYFVPDMVYNRNKFLRGFQNLIMVLGADHLGYVKRLKAAVKAISENPNADIDIKLCQIVRFLENGSIVRMSKRKGTFTTVREILDVVDADILRFMMVTKKNDMQLDFDIALALEQTKENPIFYIQYAYSRCRSLIAKFPDFKDADLTLIEDSKFNLAKKILDFPNIVDVAVRRHEPHIIANYLYDISSILHSAWNDGNKDAAQRFIIESNPALTRANIFLINATKNIIATGFDILKITPLEAM